MGTGYSLLGRFTLQRKIPRNEKKNIRNKTSKILKRGLEISFLSFTLILNIMLFKYSRKPEIETAYLSQCPVGFNLSQLQGDCLFLINSNTQTKYICINT